MSIHQIPTVLTSYRQRYNMPVTSQTNQTANTNLIPTSPLAAPLSLPQLLYTSMPPHTHYTHHTSHITRVIHMTYHTSHITHHIHIHKPSNDNYQLIDTPTQSSSQCYSTLLYSSLLPLLYTQLNLTKKPSSPSLPTLSSYQHRNSSSPIDVYIHARPSYLSTANKVYQTKLSRIK
jgi:hypothetical protein